MKRILIADDLAIVREPIEIALRHAGYETLPARDGREALKFAQQHRPDLVILDVEMPNMSGLECLRVMRTLEDTRHIPVIILTVHAERSTVQQIVACGVAGYLLKGRFSFPELLAKIKALLEAVPVQASEPSPGDSAAAPPPRSEANDAPAIPAPKRRPEVLERIAEETSLRAIPPVLHHILSLVNNRSTTLDEIAQVVRQDQALAVRILKFANSSFFRSEKRAETLLDAVHRIGLSSIGNIVAALVTMEQFTSAERSGLVPQYFWEHSLAVGAVAEEIGHAVQFEAADQETLFLAGLMHDVGRVLLATAYPEEYGVLLETAPRQRASLGALERRVFRITHAEATRHALISWKLASAVATAASLHDGTLDELRRAGSPGKTGMIVALADRLVHALIIGHSGDGTLLPIREHARAVGITDEALQRVADRIVERMQDQIFFYASREYQPMAGTVAEQLAARVARAPTVSVRASTPGFDPLVHFFRRLGWMTGGAPDVEIVSASSRSECDRLVKEAVDARRRTGHTCPMLVCAWAPLEGGFTPPPGCPCRMIDGVIRYEDVVDAIVSLTSLAPSAAEPVAV